MIRFENVTKKYGSRAVLEGLSLEIEPGEFVTVTGASGSGKSTLVHLLIGADQPSDGRIFVDDIDVTSLDFEDLQKYRRTVGVIFQDYKLLPKKSVFENVAYALEVTGEEEYEVIKKVSDVLAKVGLQEHFDHYPHQLSGGEAQRVALARALVHEPRLLIADEPTGNLDPENAHNMMMLIKKINEDGVTILLVTHNPELIRHAPKRALKLEKGKLL